MAKSQKRKTLIKMEDKPLIHIGHGQERALRKHARALFQVSAKHTKKKDIHVYSEDISTTGAFLETPDPLPPSTKANYVFH